MLREFESPGVFELDYGDGIGETSKGSVDPWTGKVDPATFAGATAVCDPDRTSRVKVNPWTGEVLDVGVRSAPPMSETTPAATSTPAVDLPGRPPSSPLPALVLPADRSPFGRRAIALVAAASLVGGATLGIAVTLWLAV